MNLFKSFGVVLLAGTITASSVSPVFANGDEKFLQSTEERTVSSEESKLLAMDLAMNGNIVETKEPVFNFQAEGGIMPLLNNNVGVGGGSYDGYYTSKYTIPAYITAGGGAMIATWLASYTAMNPAVVAGVVTAAGTYAGKDVRVESLVYYTWVKKYTKCSYVASSKIYSNGVYKKTVTKSWTGEIDNNID